MKKNPSQSAVRVLSVKKASVGEVVGKIWVEPCPITDQKGKKSDLTHKHKGKFSPGVGERSSGGSRGGVRGAAPLPRPIFRPNWGPKGRKNFFLRPVPPYLRVWVTSPPTLYLKVSISRWGALWMFKTSALSGSVFIPNRPPKLKSCNLPF